MFNMIIDMDGLEKNNVIMDSFDKTFTYVVVKVRGFSKPVAKRKVSTLQLKKGMKKAASCMQCES